MRNRGWGAQERGRRVQESEKKVRGGEIRKEERGKCEKRRGMKDERLKVTEYKWRREWHSSKQLHNHRHVYLCLLTFMQCLQVINACT